MARPSGSDRSLDPSVFTRLLAESTDRVLRVSRGVVPALDGRKAELVRDDGAGLLPLVQDRLGDAILERLPLSTR
jgi:hypothetical protein